MLFLPHSHHLNHTSLPLPTPIAPFIQIFFLPKLVGKKSKSDVSNLEEPHNTTIKIQFLHHNRLYSKFLNYYYPIIIHYKSIKNTHIRSSPVSMLTVPSVVMNSDCVSSSEREVLKIDD